MGLDYQSLQKNIHDDSLKIQEDPQFAYQLLPKLCQYLKYGDNNLDLYKIYIHLHTSLTNKEDSESLEFLQSVVLDARLKPLASNMFHTTKVFNSHQMIMGYFFMRIMQGNRDETLRSSDFYEFFRVLNADLDEFLSLGNTALIWAVANSNFSTVHKFLDAIAFYKEQVAIDIDKHCTRYCMGSALFLACVKGEMHQNTDVPESSALNDRMESVILKLLKLGASPIDRCDYNDELDALGIMVLRRSPKMLKLMLEHLPQPLTSNDIKFLKSYLSLSYEESINLFYRLAIPITIPTEEDWVKNHHQIVGILLKYKPLEKDENSPDTFEQKQIATMPSVSTCQDSLFNKHSSKKIEVEPIKLLTFVPG